MIEWLTRDVPDLFGGIGLLLAGATCMVWGFVSLLNGWTAREGNDVERRDGFWAAARYPLQCIVAQIPRAFNFWLGIFLLISDAGIYFILGFSVIRDEDGGPLWGVIYSVLIGVISCIAFWAWSHERREP